VGKEAQGHPDATLAGRAMQALGAAFLERHADPAALVPVVPRLAALAADPKQPGENGNLAFDLIARTGKDHCLLPLAKLARSHDPVRSWSAVQHGLACAGVDGIQPMAEALPTDRDYDPAIIEKYFWKDAAALGTGAATPARTLLGSASWVARLTGAELLAKLGTPSDAQLLRTLAKDSAPLRGWTVPTVGAEATKLADRLEKVQ